MNLEVGILMRDIEENVKCRDHDYTERYAVHFVGI
jgi:hypothetical protein